MTCPRAHLLLLAASLPVIAAGGCYWRDMKNQDRANPEAQTSFFQDGASARHLPEGTVARDETPVDSDISGDSPPPRPTTTAALLSRGRERFDIYCSMCHGRDGYGEGIVVQRGLPPPPSFHTDAIRTLSDEHFYKVITAGLGKMPPYRDTVKPADRWAIVAYIRALQLSQHADIASLPRDLRDQLQQGGAP